VANRTITGCGYEEIIANTVARSLRAIPQSAVAYRFPFNYENMQVLAI
jgi:hypothetical protein